MPENADVLIIGGGVIGLTAAYFLAREHLRVEIVDQSDFGQEASWAGAGILPPGNLERARTPFDQLRALSAALFPKLSAELKELTGVDNGYLRSGGLEFFEPGVSSSAEEWRSEGIACELVKGEDLHRLEPALSPNLKSAYFLPGMAQLRNPRHLQALLAACRLHGVRLRPCCPVVGFEREGRHIKALKTQASRLQSDRYLVAAGAWTDSLLESFNCRLRIRPIRGQIALLNTGAPIIHKVLVEGSRYLVPRADGRVLVGSTEEDVGFDKRTTARAIHELLAFALKLVPELADHPVERCWSGLRPGSPDELPFIGRLPDHDNVFVAAGHFRSGIQLSPGTALLVKEMLLGGLRSVPIEPFRIDR
jgi:glycine oxidase